MERHQPHTAGDLHDLIVDGLETDTLDIAWSAANDIFREAFARDLRRSIKDLAKRPDLNPTDAGIPSTHQLSVHTIGLTTNDGQHQWEQWKICEPAGPRRHDDTLRQKSHQWVRMSQDFTRTGACKNGDKCMRSHSEPPESTKKIVPYTAHFGTVDYDSDFFYDN